MGKKIDMTGKRYGRLVIISEAGRANKHVRWNAVCDCGEEVIIRGVDVRNGAVVSCGCRKREQIIKVNDERRQAKKEREMINNG